MTLHGQNIVGSSRSQAGDQTFFGVDPASGEALSTTFADATPQEIDRAVALAIEAHPAFEAAGREARAGLLEKIADEIEALGDELVERMHAETALPRARAVGERGRTVGQLRLFAGLVREGTWLDLRIDLARPDRAPLPKPDVRRINRAVGPVAVFGASNFPLAFSVAGGDTASALAAGCPVVVKGHPAHPGTGEMVGEAIARAVKACGLPAGVFSLVQGKSNGVGEHLVRHPGIKAVGFTGSIRGGRALFDLAAARPEPIPVYAEMGSINPVFVFPGAVKARGEAIASGLAASVTSAVGQFCTNPGVVVVRDDGDTEAFLDQLATQLRGSAPGIMLHAGIANAYRQGVRGLVARADVSVQAGANEVDAEPAQVSAAMLVTDAKAFSENPELREEVFGPVTVVVRCASEGEFLRVAASLPGQLSATIHCEDAEVDSCGALFEVLTQRAGRVLFNGFPTGVEVCGAMVHGGPYPATTAPQSTSVGTAAIHRFVRPVAYQDAPASLLPPELHDANRDGLLRMIDGQWTREPVG
jgi:alpha-ketoglutaric semialdehyde dehydrogenase